MTLLINVNTCISLFFGPHYEILHLGVLITAPKSGLLRFGVALDSSCSHSLRPLHKHTLRGSVTNSGEKSGSAARSRVVRFDARQDEVSELPFPPPN